MSENNESPKTEKPTFRRVLVVEDDEGLNKLAQKALREIGCSAVGTSNGAEAIEYVMTSPDVVLLLDIKLPDMTGGELISVLNERGCSVPFIAMTGHGDERTAVEMMKLGARDYLVKDLDLVHRLPGVFERLFRELDTDRKLLAATKKLHESEERFERAMEATKDGLYDWDLITNELYMSPGWKGMLGYGCDELPNDFSVWETLTDPEDVQRAWKMQRELVGGHRDRFELEFRMRHRDGHWVDILSRANAFFDKNGNAIRIVGTHLDITERKQKERDLEKAQAILLNAEQIAEQGSWEWDLVKDEWTLSNNWQRIHGTNVGSISHAALMLIAHPDDVTRVEAAIQAALTGRARYDLEHRIVRMNDGQVRIVHAIGDVICDAGGQPLRMYGVAQDITDIRNAEQERRQLEQQIQQTQKLESLGVMAGGIAHDFNNILCAILGNADIALEAMPPEAVGRSSLHEIQTAARRASGLTDQMLAYSGKGALAIEKMHLSELVQEMVHLLEVSHTKKAILKYRFEESLPAIEGDASQLRQVVMNLITNASEAEGDEGGIIAVTTGVTEATAEYLAATYANDGLPAGRYVYLEVTDTGCGMDEETQRRIFEPFFTTKFTGRGLGMAAVLGIVRAHKGAIDIQSEVDHGTAIKVLFPALDEAAASPSEEPAQEDWRGNGTVLVVDDETSILKLTKRLLERKGFAVLTAEDGKQAVEVFRENRDAIACVVTDLTMPRMGGEEALVEIHQIRKDVPVVLASGFSEEQLKERVQNLGFAGFLKKPFQNRDLLDKVRAVLKL